MNFDPIKPPRDYSLTDWYHERIHKQIKNLFSQIDSDEEIHAIAILEDGSRIQATWFGYHNPNMLIVHGYDDQGDYVRLLVAHTNIQLLLKVKKRDEGDERRPIGFQGQTDASDEDNNTSNY